MKSKYNKRNKTPVSQLVGYLTRKIDFNAKTDQRIIFDIDDMQIDCIVKPLKPVAPAPNQLSLFPDSFLEKSSRKYD